MDKNTLPEDIDISDYFYALRLLEQADRQASRVFKLALGTLGDLNVFEFFSSIALGERPENVSISKTYNNRETYVCLSLDWHNGMTMSVEKRRAFGNNKRQKITLFPINDYAIKDGITFATVSNGTQVYARGIEGHIRYVATETRDGYIKISAFDQFGSSIEDETQTEI